MAENRVTTPDEQLEELARASNLSESDKDAAALIARRMAETLMVESRRTPIQNRKETLSLAVALMVKSVLMLE